MHACILIRTLPGKVETTLNDIKKIENVVKAFPVYGRYDIVAFVEAPNFQSIFKTSGKINGIKGVKSTETAVEG